MTYNGPTLNLIHLSLIEFNGILFGLNSVNFTYKTKKLSSNKTQTLIKIFKFF